MSKVNSLDLQEQLSRLSRQDSSTRQERDLVAATGTAPSAWTVKIVSLVQFNLYTVEQVRIHTIGYSPGPVGGSNTQAYNLAEAFNQTGTLTAGAYAVMWRVGDKNVIYVKP